MANNRPTPYQIHAPIIGKTLFQIALRWSNPDKMPTSQKAREEAIVGLGRRKRVINGSRSKKTAREAVETAVEAIRDARTARNRTPVRRLSDGPYVTRPYKPVRLPQGTLEQRLHARTERGVLEALRTHYRQDKAGTTKVALTREPDEVGVEQTTHRDFDYYSSSTPWAKQITHTKITVSHGWLIRVAKAGLTRAGGLLTLDAQSIETTPEGITLYAATWLEQSRGYTLRAVSGVIAMDDNGQHYHSADRKTALRGLRRKRNAVAADQKAVDVLQSHGIDAVAASCPDLLVRLSDARATGACEDGIRSWCCANGLDYERGQATLAEVYAAYRQDSQPEARAVLLRVIRRHRGLVRKAFNHDRQAA